LQDDILKTPEPSTLDIWSRIIDNFGETGQKRKLLKITFLRLL